jgi:hypothetical protein
MSEKNLHALTVE